MKRNWRVWLAAVCAGLMALGVQAQSAPEARKPARGEGAQEQEIRRAMEQVVTSADAIESVRKTQYGNFFEVVLTNGDILYVDPTGSFFIAGSLIDIKGRRDVTAERTRELQTINFADLPLANAIKQVRGNGKRVLVTFEDPNCSYCKKLARDVLALKDTTIYTFLTPILSQDSAEKSRAIWCASDRAKAWNDWMVDNRLPPAVGNRRCDTPIAQNLELQKRFRISGTPTMFLVDGSRHGGYVPLAQLERSIIEAHEKVAKK